MSILNSIRLQVKKNDDYNLKAHCVKTVYVGSGEPRNMVRQRFKE